MMAERAMASPRTDMTAAAVRMLMPSSSKASSIAADTSGSSEGASRSSASATVTVTPSRANICASSSPTAFPPITSIDSGSSVSSIAVVEVRYPAPASPPMGGIHGAAPVATRYCPASTVAVPPSLSRTWSTGASGPPVNRAVPAMISQP